MRLFPQLLFVFAIGLSSAIADVKISQHDDCFRIEIDGKLFTEWQMKAWGVPYLYPVIGPNGENITRHYPMKDGVEGEQQDHPHHRAIRFSHREVNGASFWSPDGNQGGFVATIKLVKVEKMEGGKTGELIFWNSWKLDEKEILKEKVRLTFHPMANREVQMDYDTTLTAPTEDVLFKDNKDGGLGIRVAGTMVVENRKTKTGKGTIINANGEKNAEAWGKRATWADYHGPDAGGKTVGVAIFDHPSNFRHPVHWHARTYGLITANRFGTGHFEKSKGAKMGDGDHTIKKGDTLALRHRLYFHHGTAAEAKVGEKYSAYVADK